MRLFALLSLIATTLNLAANNDFTITGTFDSNTYDGKTIYLKSFESMKTFETIDSTLVKGNTFEIKGTVKDYPVMGVLHILSPEFTQPLAIEPGNVELTYSSSKANVKGGAKNTELQGFFDEQEELGKKAQAIGQSDPAFGEMIVLAKKSVINLIANNKTNNIGEYILISGVNILDKDDLSTLIDGMRPQFLKSQFGSEIKKYTRSTEIGIGNSFRDIKLPNETGKKIAISDFVGKNNKVVLLDFWASWCGPCRKEMPTIVEAYNKYKSKGFEIIGISLDDNQDAWTRAIKSMNMTWPQMSDLGGWRSEAAALYNVTSIPFTLLLDKDGQVIAMNLRGEQLLKKLEELLK